MTKLTLTFDGATGGITLQPGDSPLLQSPLPIKPEISGSTVGYVDEYNNYIITNPESGITYEFVVYYVGFTVHSTLHFSYVSPTEITNPNLFEGKSYVKVIATNYLNNKIDSDPIEVTSTYRPEPPFKPYFSGPTELMPVSDSYYMVTNMEWDVEYIWTKTDYEGNWMGYVMQPGMYLMVSDIMGYVDLYVTAVRDGLSTDSDILRVTLI